MEKTDTASVQKETGVPRAPLGLRDILQGPQKAGVKLSGRTGAPLWAPPPASLSSRSSQAVANQTELRLVKGVGHGSQRNWHPLKNGAS